ncbi:hypothetical protein tinsulaeT_21330 [Thalassotalea insulae]|uniref:Oligosaccharide repeat unit polymerase n=1 Tax=Thalassotalea insulae TaxID=2056778 RepID=A0ABQ6GS82_9GAMM|nr:O-antigen polysaccharide polymerase Wzy [Thalassotalea insulae]GLX78793.1 hypothetical protein tinsulaeT_21330 [Thalassotalea insulae]
MMSATRLDILVLAIILNFAICLFTMLLRQWVVDTDIDFILIAQSLGILSLLIIHSVVWLKIGGNFLSLAYVFFLMVFIFNLGKSVLFVFYSEQGAAFFNFFSKADNQVIVRAIEYGYVGLLIISSTMLLTFNNTVIQVKQPSFLQLSAAKYTGIIFLTFSAPATLIDLYAIVSQVMAGGYFALFNSQQNYGVSGLFKVLSFFLYPAFYLLVVVYRKNKTIIYSIFLVAFAIAFLKLMLGMRLVALVPFIILLSLWDCTVKTLNRKLVYGGAAFLFTVIFPALSLLRTGQNISQHVENSSALYRIISEMSDSISPLIWIMQRVPSQMDFIYGDSLLLALTTIVPNLFWDVHPAKAGSLALWLVNEVNPWIAERGGGYGFSIFAEMYLNFYWYGMIVLALFTMFINKMALVRKNPINTAFAFSCFLGFLLWPRGEAVAVARFIFWNVGFLWISYHILLLVFHRIK